MNQFEVTFAGFGGLSQQLQPSDFSIAEKSPISVGALRIDCTITPFPDANQVR